MRITTYDGLMELLDSLYADGSDRTSSGAAPFWDTLYQQEEHPLTSDLPDASLVAWQAEGLLGDRPDRTALDVGCGLGRNSRWLATHGFTTTGVDIAPDALALAARRSQGQDVTYVQRDFLRATPTGAAFDLVYDSGCFHHLAPHRRISYMQALETSLAPGGLFGICTFAAGRMGTTSTDADLLRQGRLEGGVGYTLDELLEMFGWLEAVDAGPMPAAPAVREPVFTHDFLNVALFRRPSQD
jgi:SAM-dependent methyltransferase